MVYCVSYDLKKPDRNFDLINELKSFGTWWHQTGSVWIIVTSKTTAEVRDYLMQFIDSSNDKLFVIQLNKNWAAVGFNDQEYNWMKSIPDASWNS